MHCFTLPEDVPRRILLEVVDAWATPADGSSPFGDVREGGIRIRGWMKKMVAWSVMTAGGSQEAVWDIASIFEPDADFEHGGLYTRGGIGRAHMDDVARFVGSKEGRKEVWFVPIMVYQPERNENW